MSLTIKIRTAISDLHQAIELTAFSKAMLGDYIHRNDYSRALVQLWHIHNAVESAFQSNSSIQKFFSPEMMRTATLIRDLNFFGMNESAFKQLPATASIVERTSQWAAKQPLCILGALYVLEGSRMGSLFIAKTLSKALGLDPEANGGIEYHTEGAAHTPIRFRSLKQSFDGSITEHSEQRDVVDGAYQFMSLFFDLYSTLPVSEKTPPVHFHQATHRSVQV